ncbi:MAG: metalloregulator ArsR/SmtB family transcription factor [Planctomycetota bacterium]
MTKANATCGTGDGAELFRVLGDGTRLGVVMQLMNGPRRVGELNESLGVEQSLLSHHLRVLRDAGLVTAERDGKAVVYRVAESLQDPDRAGTIDLGCCRLSFPGLPGAAE